MSEARLAPRAAPGFHQTSAIAFSDSPSALSHRYGLIGLSAVALAILAGSTPILGFILLTVAASYGGLTAGQHWIDQAINQERTRVWLVRANWSLWIIAFVSLELTGAVGTLTGNSAQLIDQWAVTLGLPFYVLSMAAANADVLAGRRMKPDFSLYLLYVIYFPKFLSGPIEQPAFLGVLGSFRFSLDWARIDRGARWVVLGAFYKFIIGRLLARLYFPELADDALTLSTGIIAFELRVYFDLCGYSLMAYGISLMLGPELTLNFNHPFFAGNVRDFWRAWHISLGRWFHQYVYGPFRESGINARWFHYAPLLVFMVSAAWHGITANFFLWGLFHASAFLLYANVLRHYRWPRLVGWMAFFAVLLFGRLLFMDDNLPRLLTKFGTLADPMQWLAIIEQPSATLQRLLGLASPGTWQMLLAAVGFVLFTEWQNVRRKLPAYSLFMGWRMLVVVVVMVLMASNGSEGMIYARQ
ncbi:MBOAT family O-acyltransferase [uncultured Nevskia sp.]|uniref:MBOAT family O-acyltransferase n=1 Tax=uncultured Nevskia sp. TaxID=228950 RepID=UPI0025F06A44|nr:MBOAT family O-acyltransferase [uncultured Nevskia sp.]